MKKLDRQYMAIDEAIAILKTKKGAGKKKKTHVKIELMYDGGIIETMSMLEGMKTMLEFEGQPRMNVAHNGGVMGEWEAQVATELEDNQKADWCNL